MKMKPCCFCGSTKTSVKTKSTNHYMYERVVASVRCHSCNARGPAIGESIQLGSSGEEARGGVSYFDAKLALGDKAIELWNKRIVIETK